MRISKKEALLLFSILLIPLFSSTVLAEIILTQPESQYNIGDYFEITIKISSPLKSTSDFLTADLLCNNESIELFRSPYSVPEGTDKDAIIATNLDNFLVGKASGRCYISARFAGQEAQSQRFILSRLIDVSLNIDGIVFLPGDNVKASGQALKTGSKPAEGFVEISIPTTNLTFTSPVLDGEFDFNFTIPENSPSGNFDIKARVYEADPQGFVTNEGSAISTLKIKAVIKKVEIALNEQTILPNQDLRFSVSVLDQAGASQNVDVPVEVYRPDDSVSAEKLVKSDKSNTIPITSNFTPGYWKIRAEAGGIETVRTFFVEEFEDLTYLLENNTLIITNTGNVPYEGPIEISIGDVSEIKEVAKLKIGEFKKFKLAAPDGEYGINVGDGEKRLELGSTFLTGNAISVSDVGGVLSDNLTTLIAIIIILIIAIIGLYIYRKISKDRIPGSKSRKPSKFGNLFKRKTKKINDIKIPKSTAVSVESHTPSTTAIDKGEKQESSIISLQIKNSNFLKPNSTALKSIDSALWKAKEAGAKIYSDGDFRIIVFAPILTKSKDNSIKAISIAQTIERSIQTHNKRFADKIEFGIGVNSGNLVVEKKDGKFKFMSVDNTIASTKKISMNANSETLLSENIRRKTAGKVKAQKLSDHNLWKVNKVIDRSQHKKYVDNLKYDKYEPN